MRVGKIGLDIGSTTIKVVVLDEAEQLRFSCYERHNAKIGETLGRVLDEMGRLFPTESFCLRITGSVGLGLAERSGADFMQEVVASTTYIKRYYPQASTMIDIGGEDAKVVFLHAGTPDMRMNGNCAGGTGAFIDQMALLLNTTPQGLDELAAKARHLYPMASRCGVFAKTDVQNLVARHAGAEDIAASIFRAVAVQTIVTLSRGCDITPPVLFCGGPLAFLPALRKAFADYLALAPEHMIVPDNAQLLPAWGCAVSAGGEKCCPIEGWKARLLAVPQTDVRTYAALPALFTAPADYAAWKVRKAAGNKVEAALLPGRNEMILGIDSGSTTTKIVALDKRKHLLFSHYAANDGNPIQAVSNGLRKLLEACRQAGAVPVITGSCVTGYGEDLIKAAFRLESGMIETIAHYLAARELAPDVSFILDIGGQDMKAIFVERGVLSKMELNEACSSGCGSFLENFANSLGYSSADFSAMACKAAYPCDLGTRCTVFMNSKVKQMLREGAALEDIAAGLSYSVVKNCLYKVLKLKSVEELGTKIVVQGGTMRNDAVVRAFESLLGREVFRSDRPELMGAYGCALYAMQGATRDIPLEEMLNAAAFTADELSCKGCENNCVIARYRFANGNIYFSGNKCERHFSNRGDYRNQTGRNAYADKLHLLFDRNEAVRSGLAPGRYRIGVPRCLNMYEDFPFWRTLLVACGMEVVLSDGSSMAAYEKNACKVMSDNICFPAKLVHGHIDNLLEKGVNRILMPYALYERQEGKADANSYNCPIVTGYSDVVRSVGKLPVPLDTPAVSFKEEKRLYTQIRRYLSGLGVDESQIRPAFEKAMAAQQDYMDSIREVNQDILEQSRREGRLAILLAGRPYHSDPLVQHKIAESIAAMGVDVLTDDIVRGLDLPLADTHFVSQWAYPNRILRAASFVAAQDASLQLVQMTSFGCGPDALLTDEVRDLLGRYRKTLTLLKIDDISNTGSLKLRVRSLVESLRLEERLSGQEQERGHKGEDFVTTPPFEKKDRDRKILVPFFTPFMSPLIPALFQRAGYDAEPLPPPSVFTADTGLKYANNEICYPATLVVGDILTALLSGKYDRERIAVAITQTGGQCRASSYLSLIKRAMVSAGYTDIPVISVSTGSGLKTAQPGFSLPWGRILRATIASIVFSDALARLYYATAVRETRPGAAASIKDCYLEKARQLVLTQPERVQFKLFRRLLHEAVGEFLSVTRVGQTCPKVGVVGEIYLKFNAFANKGVVDWMVEQGIEVIFPVLIDFFMQGFVNREVNKASGVEDSSLPDWAMRFLAGRMQKIIESFNVIAAKHPYYHPLGNIYQEARAASEIISLNAQFGEGWLLPGEIALFAREGIRHVVSLQPFGCIANHIVAKGVEKRIKELYPGMNLLALDFDGSVSDVNVMNRMLLFIDSLKQ